MTRALGVGVGLLVLALAARPVVAEVTPEMTPEVTPEVTIERLAAQPALATTVRAKPAELAAAVQRAILALVAAAPDGQIAGPPFARYPAGPPARAARGTVVVEVGLPVRALPRDVRAGASAGRGRRWIALPAGPAAVLVHTGPHAELWRAHAALDAWLANARHTAAGPRWEVYVTNPITTPDPGAQVTRIYAPLAD